MYIINVQVEEIDDKDYLCKESSQQASDYVPLSYKQGAVAMTMLYPNWKLKTLQKKGFAQLKSERTLAQWKKDVKCGGTHFDKWKNTDEETYNRFIEAIRNNKQVNLIKYMLYVMSEENWFIRTV